MIPVTRDEFEAMVEEAIKALPLWILREAEGTVEFLVAEEPDPEDFPHVPPHMRPGALGSAAWVVEVYGFYSGMPLPLRRLSPFPWPPSVIRVYRQPCLRANADLTALRFQVRTLVEHEMGHHFGLTEGEIARAHRRTPEA